MTRFYTTLFVVFVCALLAACGGSPKETRESNLQETYKIHAEHLSDDLEKLGRYEEYLDYAEYMGPLVIQDDEYGFDHAEDEVADCVFEKQLERTVSDMPEQLYEEWLALGGISGDSERSTTIMILAGYLNRMDAFQECQGQ